MGFFAFFAQPNLSNCEQIDEELYHNVKNGVYNPVIGMFYEEVEICHADGSVKKGYVAISPTRPEGISVVYGEGTNGIAEDLNH